MTIAVTFDQFVDLVEVLKWPVVALITFFAVLGPVRRRMKKLKMGPDGVEVDLGEPEPWNDFRPAGVVVVIEIDNEDEDEDEEQVIEIDDEATPSPLPQGGQDEPPSEPSEPSE